MAECKAPDRMIRYDSDNCGEMFPGLFCQWGVDAPSSPTGEWCKMFNEPIEHDGKRCQACLDWTAQQEAHDDDA